MLWNALVVYIDRLYVSAVERTSEHRIEGIVVAAQYGVARRLVDDRGGLSVTRSFVAHAHPRVCNRTKAALGQREVTTTELRDLHILRFLEIEHGTVGLDGLQLIGLLQYFLCTQFEVCIVDELRTRAGKNRINVSFLQFALALEQCIGTESKHAQHFVLGQFLQLFRGLL
jgi:hypothetical protein